MRVNQATIKQFAETIAKITKSDRYVLMGVGGFMGIGKSCFLTQLAEEYAKLTNTPFSYNDNMTWLREELIGWIDGEDKEKKGQKPEYSAIVADEFISMFYKRNWYKEEQKETIELFNKIRDRHLFIGGALPNFWDLDKGLLSNISFYVYISERGRAWVFQQENNPFSLDVWNVQENFKVFRKGKNPYKCYNFVAEILFNDWKPERKKEYYKIRNKKRVNTEGQNEKKNIIQSKAVKQRNELIRYLVKNNIQNKKEVVKNLDLTPQYVGLVLRGKQ